MSDAAIGRLLTCCNSSFAFFIQSSAASGDGVTTDKQGRIVLGGNKFAIISKRLVREKVTGLDLIALTFGS